MKTLCCLAVSALFAAGLLAGPVPAPDSLLAPAQTDTLTDYDLGVFPPEGILAPYSYQIDWGDGTTDDWTEPLRMGFEAYFGHRYEQEGEFGIRVRVRDSLNRVSDWSRPLPVRVTEPVRKWVFETFDPVLTTPALDRDGNIYIGDETGWLFSVAPDGVLRWGFQADDAIYSAAVLDDRHVYFGSLDSHLYCLNREGRLVWKQNLGDEIYTPPALDSRGNIIAVTDAGGVFALSPAPRVPLFRRRVLWRFEVGEEIAGSPSIAADGSIFVAADSLYCLDPGGRRRWAFGSSDENFFFASPVPDPDGNVVIGNTEGRIYAVGPDGRLAWQAATPDEDAMLAEFVARPDGSFIFGTESGLLYRLDPPAGTSGAQVVPLFETFDLIPAAAAVSDKGTVYFVSEDGFVYALRADGRLQWRQELAIGDKEMYYASSPVIGPDGTVYIGSWDGGLYAFRGDGPPAPSFWPQYRRDAAHTGRLDE